MKKRLLTAALASIPLLGNVNCYYWNSIITCTGGVDAVIECVGAKRCNTGDNYFCFAYTSELQEIVERLEQYIGKELDFTIITGYDINSYAVPTKNHILFSDDLIEICTYAAKGYAYKQAHPDFNLMSYFEQMVEETAEEDEHGFSMETGSYDLGLEAKVREAALAFLLAHEAGHLVHRFLIDGGCEVWRSCEFEADNFAVDFLASSYGVEMPESALVALKIRTAISSMWGYYPSMEFCTHPSNVSRTENARARLHEHGIDTSAVDAAFE